MAHTTPGPESRWRCGHCGNLTRFTVTRTRTTTEYWHVSLDGEPTVQEQTVEAESIASVRCRWCGSQDAIEVVPRPDASSGTEPEPGLGGTP